MNPRWGYPHNGFQDRRIKPLCHPSAKLPATQTTQRHPSVKTTYNSNNTTILPTSPFYTRSSTRVTTMDCDQLIVKPKGTKHESSRILGKCRTKWMFFVGEVPVCPPRAAAGVAGLLPLPLYGSVEPPKTASSKPNLVFAPR